MPKVTLKQFKQSREGGFVKYAGRDFPGFYKKVDSARDSIGCEHCWDDIIIPAIVTQKLKVLDEIKNLRNVLYEEQQRI